MKGLYISQLKQFFLILVFFSFSLAENANSGNEMNQKKFDYVSYGRINKNELTVKLHLWKGADGPTLTSQSKPQQLAEPKIELANKSINSKAISSALEFTNVSSRELHLENRLWSLRLIVVANKKPLKYIGAMLSMAPPKESDFVTLKPGEKFATEPAILNSNYGIPDDFKGTLQVTYQFSSETPVAEASLSVNN